MMIMLLNQKYEIFPTEDQKETLDCWLQYCRQTYNSALLDKQRMYKQSKTPYNRFDMQRQLKLDKEKHVFLKEMPSKTLQEVFIQLYKYFTNLFRNDSVSTYINKYNITHRMT